MNHMCFGESARMKFTSLLASHPPVEERINAIQPGMLARLRSRLRDTEPGNRLYSGPAPSAGAAAFAGGQPRASTSPLASSLSPPTNTRKFSDQVGTVNRRSEDFALQFLERLPATFRNLLYTRAGAIQLCYGLLISELPRQQQTERLGLLPDHPVLGSQPDLLDKLLPALKTIGEGVRFPALELAMPALRKLDPEERELLITNVQKLVAADNRVTLFELALTSFLSRHLGDEAERVVPVRYKSYRPVLPALQRVLSLLARAGTENQDEAEVLYQEAMAGFVDGRSDKAPTLEKVTMRQLREALTALNGLSPLLKPAVIDACGYCITRDGRVDAREYELMRLVADQIDCPMPPLSV